MRKLPVALRTEEAMIVHADDQLRRGAGGGDHGRIVHVRRHHDVRAKRRDEFRDGAGRGRARCFVVGAPRNFGGLRPERVRLNDAPADDRHLDAAPGERRKHP